MATYISSKPVISQGKFARRVLSLAANRLWTLLSRFSIVDLMLRQIFQFSLLACFLAGCRGPVETAFPGDAHWILKVPDQLELMTLDPDLERFDAKNAVAMHGYPILGTTRISDSATRDQLIKGLFGSLQPEGPRSACFNPRHAIRAMRGGKTVDVVICFECHLIWVYSGTRLTATTINDSAQATYEKVAEQAGLPAATRPH